MLYAVYLLLPVSDGLGVAHAVPEQLLHPRPALAEDAEPRQPRPRSCSVAPVIRHHALTLVLLGSLELISEVISDDDPHLDEAAILTQYRGPHLPGRDQRSGAG